jgi:hypothetical protein
MNEKRDSPYGFSFIVPRSSFRVAFVWHPFCIFLWLDFAEAGFFKE